jgi:hypothetical protein
MASNLSDLLRQVAAEHKAEVDGLHAKILALESEVASLKEAKSMKTKVRAGVPASYSADDELKLMIRRTVWREEKVCRRRCEAALKMGKPVTDDMVWRPTEEQTRVMNEYKAEKKAMKKAAAPVAA